MQLAKTYSNGAIQNAPAKPVDTLKNYLNASSVQAQFSNALGAHKDAFVASLIDLFTGDASLQKCNPGAIISEALRAATMNMPLNKALGFAYIVVYNNKVKDANGRDSFVPTPTFIPGYKGYIQLAMRTGQYRTINADVVYEGEIRKTNKLTGEISIDGEKTSDKIVGYFCYFELLNGFSKTLFMTVDEMVQYAKKYSKSIGRNVSVEDLTKRAMDNTASGAVGWMGNFTAMAIKTVVRRLLSKYGYLSVEMQNAVASDTNYDAASSRDEIIATSANSEVLTTTDADYEDVDTETGEVRNTTAPASDQCPPAEEGPDY